MDDVFMGHEPEETAKLTELYNHYSAHMSLHYRIDRVEEQPDHSRLRCHVLAPVMLFE